MRVTPRLSPSARCRVDELAASITAFNWDSEKGELTPYQTVPILGKDYKGTTNTSAEIVVSKDGRFVYGSNRGDDSIANLTWNDNTEADVTGYRVYRAQGSTVSATPDDLVATVYKPSYTDATGAAQSVKVTLIQGPAA